ncbi:nucleotide exchange factor GrpE [Alkanindiges hydrocarboniclasticus]|uniref:Protein GrpE n=2 Tax=Alkanindiges hydrocarboniclasticus TaxID=1907941 RepID=A0A1S8CV21_9GAMM|nr:nucleotide exchange factor GrpE [Alkanindiges hydrocarboniclasticus]ONG41088.1 nucleotide exchange factor GrpE [Alkanindiges hydrocarboniclasticus]
MSSQDNSMPENGTTNNNEQINTQDQINNDSDFVPSGTPADDHDNNGTPEDLQARIEELEAEITEVKARANADMYNFQKRVERETDNAKKYALEKFAGSLLDVVDNLERAIAAAGNDDHLINQPVIEGVRLTHKNLLGALEKHGVSVVDPAGQPFNAELHQAVGIDPNTPAGQVANVLQKGYSLSGRLLRPAMVTVGQ